jgi:hypothetical protein
MKYLYITFLLFVLTDCTPEGLKLNMISAKNLIYTVIVGDLNNVEQINDNSFLIKNGGIASMRILGKTQNEIKFNLEFLEGDFVRFGIRTTRVNFNKKNNIIFEINGTDISLYLHGKLLQNKKIAGSVKNSKLIRILNLGDELKISVDCDEIVNIRTKLPLTEYLIVESNKNSTLKLSGIVFDLILFENKLKF